MDTLGRTTLTITAVNVVDDLRDRDLIVRYSYPFAARLRKPLIFFAGLATLLVVSWVVGNLDVSIGRKEKGLLKKRA
jgi:oligosaccharyltransferase complex subunit alpha (ribophorin I)